MKHLIIKMEPKVKEDDLFVYTETGWFEMPLALNGRLVEIKQGNKILWRAKKSKEIIQEDDAT